MQYINKIEGVVLVAISAVSTSLTFPGYNGENVTIEMNDTSLPSCFREVFTKGFCQPHTCIRDDKSTVLEATGL
jgi:hypothetical protein